MRILITGGAGFVGSTIAEFFLGQHNFELLVYDDLSRVGSGSNLESLRQFKNLEFVKGDVRNLVLLNETLKNFKPDVIIHLAAQVAMTSSMEDPRSDFEINAFGSLNVLEFCRKNLPECLIIYSSSNKVYGDLEHLEYQELEKRYSATQFPNGLNESLPPDFATPYGCSKGAADLYFVDYFRSFGVRTVVLRHSSMFGCNQFSTVDQGWVGWFMAEALRQKTGDRAPIQIAGNGKQVRDLLFGSDVATLYWNVIQNSEKAVGEAFNIGGGSANSMSILELIDTLEELLDCNLLYQTNQARNSDQKVFVSDYKKATELLGWAPKVKCKDGLKILLDELKKRQS
jgi:CDP-paratose 2-epimerase